MNAIRADSSKEKLLYENGLLSSAYVTRSEISPHFPFSSDELANAVASVTTHETGHTLGLVESVLYGSKGKHNKTALDNGWIMNTSIPFMQHYGKPSALTKSWAPRNHQYLRFILPKN